MLNQQIISAYESSEESISFEQFCAAFPDYEPEAIKMVLASGSTKYRALMRKDPQVFTEQDEELAKVTMISLLGAEKDGDRFKAAKYIINDRRGRHDVQQLKNMNVNIINIDERMKKAREAIDRAKDITLEPQPAVG